PRPLIEKVLPFGIGTSRPSFEKAYALVFDSSLPRALRKAAEQELDHALASPVPPSEWRGRLTAARELQRATIPLADSAALQAIARLVTNEVPEVTRDGR